MSWELKTFDALTNKELHDIFKLRVDIFVVEQTCPYPEIDGKDLKALHLFKKEQDNIVAYCRLLAPGVSFTEASIGRVVVHSDYRHAGLGEELMKTAIHFSIKHYNSNIQIGAQAHLEQFYSTNGFIKNSDIYLEDDIPHMDMLLTI